MLRARRQDHMLRDDVDGQKRNALGKRAEKLQRPATARGVPDTGRIAKLLVGQGHGTIRLANGRVIFFHRADMREGTSINEFRVGDLVAFERLDDHVSGARALNVVRLRTSRRQASR
jgi:hypothetical protein